MKRDDVTDREFTIVKTPGWLSKLDCSTEIDERNYFITQSLCVLVSRAVVIININIDAFIPDENRKSLLKHLSCHGKTAWIPCNGSDVQEGLSSTSYPILQNTDSVVDIVQCLKTFQINISLSPSNRSLFSRLFRQIINMRRRIHSCSDFTVRNRDIEAEHWVETNQLRNSGSPENPGDPEIPLGTKIRKYMMSCILY